MISEKMANYVWIDISTELGFYPPCKAWYEIYTDEEREYFLKDKGTLKEAVELAALRNDKPALKHAMQMWGMIVERTETPISIHYAMTRGGMDSSIKFNTLSELITAYSEMHDFTNDAKVLERMSVNVYNDDGTITTLPLQLSPGYIEYPNKKFIVCDTVTGNLVESSSFEEAKDIARKVLIREAFDFEIATYEQVRTYDEGVVVKKSSRVTHAEINALF